MLPRGGHDYRKLYAAYKMAVEHEGSPTVILAKTIKGWTLGQSIEGRNATHQIKKLTAPELKAFRDTLQLPIPDSELDDGDPPYWHPGTDSPEFEYMMARRRALDGPVPERVVRTKTLPMPATRRIADVLAGTGEKVQASTTTAFARLIRNLLRDPGIGTRVRADHPRRSAHVRARRAVPRVQDLRAVRSAVRPRRRRPPAVVPRGAQRPHPRGRHHRGGIDGVVHRRGHRVRDVGRADHPVLHLLFDVRVPAGRRPHLVVRRPARARVPARRHRGPHDASRARACSTATARASCWRRRTRTAAPTTPRSPTRWA